MKTSLKSTVGEFRLKLLSFAEGYYIKRALKLEKVLKLRPKSLRIEMIGEGEIAADTALLLRSILLTRSHETKLEMVARSSLRGGAVLLWLLGDRRTIRSDARVYFKRNPLADEDPLEVYAGMGAAEPKYQDSYSDLDPEDADYARVLELIDEYLPVREFAGRIVTVDLLREFGLLEDRRVDKALAAALAKSHPVATPT